MDEPEAIKAQVDPGNILLVVDSMIGQDAVRTAAEFNRRLEISGFCLTKLDGDARRRRDLDQGGHRQTHQVLGMGETTDKLEVFRPEGLAQRILGMGDITSLMEDFEELVDEDEAEADAQKLLSGQFTLDDFVKQIDLIGKMGNLKGVMDRMPGMGELADSGQLDEKILSR